MPISVSDIKFLLSITTATSGNHLSQPDPDLSLGLFASTTEIVDGVVGNLFDDVTGDENEALESEYRCFFVHNSHGSLTYQSPKVWIGGPRFSAEADDDIFTASGHGFADAEMVRLSASKAIDTLPGGFDNTTTYYVRDVATHTFKLASTAGGSAINVTSDGTGEARKYGTTTIEIAIDGSGASLVNAIVNQAESVANENTAPVNTGGFSGPLTKSGGLSLGSLTAGQVKAVWVKRTTLNSAARNEDGIRINVSGDTGA